MSQYNSHIVSVMSSIVVVAGANIVFEIIRQRQKKIKNHMWVHDWISRRKALGASNDLIWELLIKDNECKLSK